MEVKLKLDKDGRPSIYVEVGGDWIFLAPVDKDTKKKWAKFFKIAKALGYEDNYDKERR